MGIIIQRIKHFYIRVPVILILIAFFAVSPIIMSMVGAWITELVTNEPCHEGNCAWGAIGWLFMITMPIAILLFIVFIIILIIDIIKLVRNK